MKIRASPHFQQRINLREIPEGLGETILRNADGHYQNGVTGYLIAVRRVSFQGKDRDMALTYEHGDDEITLVTLHPLKDGQKDNRIASRRWVPYEPESKL